MGQDGRIRFEQFSFPELPGLVYEKDGNERIGEVLFIDDSRARFLISFESGMPCLDMRMRERDPEHTRWHEHTFGSLALYLCYPIRAEGACVVYFHAELTDPDGVVHILPGQMSLERPTRQLDCLRCFTALCELMDGLQFESTREEAVGA